MANVKGKIGKLAKNGGGYWIAGVIVADGVNGGKATWGNINFGDKSDKLVVDGVELKVGMLADAEVDGQWNNFVSGTFKEAPPKAAGGKPWGGKGGFEKKEYDQTGNAVGGAVNRANELLAAKLIKAEDVALVSLAQYYVSEYLIKAVKAGAEGIKAYHAAFKGVNVLELTSVVKAKNALEEALKGISPPPATTVAPKQESKPVEPAKQPEPEQQVQAEAQGEGLEFDDTPNF
jgi:hypothetical protein